MDSSALSSGGTISHNEGIHNIHPVCYALQCFIITAFNLMFPFIFTYASIAISNIAVITD